MQPESLSGLFGLVLFFDDRGLAGHDGIDGGGQRPVGGMKIEPLGLPFGILFGQSLRIVDPVPAACLFLFLGAAFRLPRKFFLSLQEPLSRSLQSTVLTPTSHQNAHR